VYWRRRLGWPEDSWFLPCGSKRPTAPLDQ
jgi:hypothetical protein